MGDMKEPKSLKACTEDAHCIMAALIQNYLDVGQPYVGYDENGWSEIAAARTAGILERWMNKHYIGSKERNPW